MKKTKTALMAEKYGINFDDSKNINRRFWDSPQPPSKFVLVSAQLSFLRLLRSSSLNYSRIPNFHEFPQFISDEIVDGFLEVVSERGGVVIFREKKRMSLADAILIIEKFEKTQKK